MVSASDRSTAAVVKFSEGSWDMRCPGATYSIDNVPSDFSQVRVHKRCTIRHDRCRTCTVSTMSQSFFLRSLLLWCLLFLLYTIMIYPVSCLLPLLSPLFSPSEPSTSPLQWGLGRLLPCCAHVLVCNIISHLMWDEKAGEVQRMPIGPTCL